ncbi:MAG: hypothetical protein QM788_14010 [Roseateles sp.]|uniref:hypothetical protein n=1 Tax=Roseateles sp. TaxID=1971397 RepID=UPI0039EBF0A1
MKRRLFYIAWPLTALLMLATLPWLPAQVGDPGKQTSREVFVAIMLCSLALAGLCSSAFVAWLGRTRPDLINLPHRAYWLAPERREATLARLGEHLSGVGLMLVLLMGGIHAFALLQGQPAWPQPPRAAWQLGAAGLVLWFLLWFWQCYRLFPAPPAPAAPARQRRPRRPGDPD